jgi:L-amino acid N-acyltransferase YncA
VRTRPAEHRDAAAIAAIWNEGIADGEATFERRPRTGEEIERALTDRDLPFLVADDEGTVVGWISLTPYSDRCAYAGVAECSVYVASTARGRGVGRALVEAVAAEAERRELHKLIGKLFPLNEPSLRLLRRCGFRDVGIHRRHGRLDGEWRDVVVVERLLGAAADR